MADGKVHLESGKVLLVGGKVALADDCCCEEEPPPPIDCTTCTSNPPTTVATVTVTGSCDGSTCCNRVAGTYEGSSYAYNEGAGECQWVFLTTGDIGTLAITFKISTGLIWGGVSGNCSGEEDAEFGAEWVANTLTCVDGNLVGELDFQGRTGVPYYCEGCTAHVVFG